MNKQLLSGCLPLYQNKLQEQRVQDVVNRDKIKFERYGDLIDQAFSQFNGNSTIKSHIAKSKMMKHQWQNIPMKIIQKTQKKNKTFAIANFMPQILPGDEIANNINSLNLKQR